MRILLTANTSWYIYNFRKGTIKHLLAQGYEVLTVAPDFEYQAHLEAIGVKHSGVFMKRSSKNPLNDLHTILSYIKLYRKLAPDIVLNFTPKCDIYSAVSAKLMKAKVINNISGLGRIFVSKSIVSYIVKWLYKFSQSFADFIFFQNMEDMNLFLSKHIVPRMKCDRINGSGVDIKYYQPKLCAKGNTLKFILVSRMLREKGVEIFAKAAGKLVEKYTEVEFLLLGPLETMGVTLSEINSWETKGWVKYLGKTDDVASVVQDCSAVVLPSYYREGVPRSLLEAGALGKPVITTDNSGCKETVIDGRTGFLCRQNDVDSLANCLERFILLNEEDRIKMGMESRKHIEENFDEKIIIEKYMEKIYSLCAKGIRQNSHVHKTTSGDKY
jgi:glycosyltransferase involved in cell wall biosynthesis